MLQGVKVLEFAGLAPAPYCGLILSDFGASVTRIDRIASFSVDTLHRGKKSVAVDLKNKEARNVVLKMVEKADVLIEPFRPGVMESLGLGPNDCSEVNKNLVYARLTGFGQHGSASKAAGHDINYIAVSGFLSLVGEEKRNPVFPGNFYGDFAAGGLLCAFGIVTALLGRNNPDNKSKGVQVIDCAIADGSTYLTYFGFKAREMWSNERGKNMLDGGAHFYQVYKTKDEKFLSVGLYPFHSEIVNQYHIAGAIEAQFYAILLKGLNLDKRNLPDQMDVFSWPDMKKKFADIFYTKTRDEWEEVFKGTDACVFPVLGMEEVSSWPHNQQRAIINQMGEPNPAPRIYTATASSPSSPSSPSPPSPPSSAGSGLLPGQHTREVLTEFGFSNTEIDQLISKKVVNQQHANL